ncbi:MAG: NAD(P)/FAD-dependent oxidoreductase [Acidaminococcaceae bacterium]|nr:NAD(P)/FAD-dependent oxidoreductase [Acidaminococcaceae bacterium]
MQLRVNDVRISLLKEKTLKECVADKLGIRKAALQKVQVLHRAVDARRKNNIGLLYHVTVEADLPQAVGKKILSRPGVSLFVPAQPEVPQLGKVPITERPVVIGAGPAGLTAALELAKYGYRPLVLERGRALHKRVEDVDRFWRTGEFDPVSNVQFGMGGAGTFSDGKLTTRVNDPVMADILQAFVKAGAPKEILTEHKPHVGTDKLRAMVQGLAAEIEHCGGEIRCETQAVDFLIKDNRLTGLLLDDGTVMATEAVILACGHSARDTYKVLASRGIGMEAKAFAIGVRVEHPQILIDQAQYGDFAGHPQLGVADYALVYHTEDRKRAAYSFCMCPGGQVVAAASEEGGVVVNGMSLYQRDSGIANSALVVNVTPDDFGTEPLAGVAFQRKYERMAFMAGGQNYKAPAQSVQSFLQGTKPTLWDAQMYLQDLSVKYRDDHPAEKTGEAFFGAMPSCRPGVTEAALESILPNYVSDTLKQGIRYFGRRIQGFDGPSGILTGVETRTSAPLRIVRGSDYQSMTHAGLYPCGEGCGYAGGIMSAALDGYHVARAIMKKYKPF